MPPLPRIGRMVSGLAAVAALIACGSGSPAAESAPRAKGAAVNFVLESPGFGSGEAIPRKYTCDGENHSPPLRWSGAPAGAAGFALVAEDPDAPGGTFVHWLIYDLPAHARELPESVPQTRELPNGARQGQNSFGNIGYGGPCPPPGPAHRYFFRLFALDAKTKLPAGAARAELDRAMKGHLLAQVEWMGKYKR